MAVETAEVSISLKTTLINPQSHERRCLCCRHGHHSMPIVSSWITISCEQFENTLYSSCCFDLKYGKDFKRNMKCICSWCVRLKSAAFNIEATYTQYKHNYALDLKIPTQNTNMACITKRRPERAHSLGYCPRYFAHVRFILETPESAAI